MTPPQQHRKLFLSLILIFITLTGLLSAIATRNMWGATGISPSMRERAILMHSLAIALISIGFLLVALIWRRRETAFLKRELERELEQRTLAEHCDYLTRYANDMILLLDEQWRILAANDRAVQMLGHAREALLKMSLGDLHPESALEELSAWMRRAEAEDGVIFESLQRRRDGALFAVELSCRRIATETGHRYQAIVRDISERKRMESELRLYQKAVETAEAPVGILDRELRYRAVNQAFLDYFWLTREAVVGRPIAEVVGEDIFHAVHEPALRQCLEGIPATRECLRQYPAAGPRHMTFSYYPLRSAEGSVDGIVLMSHDRTAQRNLDQERELMVEMLRLLNTQNDRRELIRSVLRMLLDYTECESGGIRLDDGVDYPFYESHGLSVEFLSQENQLCPRLTGCGDGGAAPGRLKPECLCGGIISGGFEAIKPYLTGGGAFWTNDTTELLAQFDDGLKSQLRLRCPGEGFRSMALAPLKVDNVAFGLIYLSDKRTGRFTAERIGVLERLADNLAIGLMRKMMTESHTRLATATEQAGEGIIITDPQGTIQYVNPAFERITGYARQEALGKSVGILRSERPDQDDLFESMWRRLSQGESWSGRMINRRKDGALYEEEASWSPVRDASGRVDYYVSIRRDTSNERNLEEQLRQSQKMEAVGRLAGGVAHDFNNLLTAISGYAEMLRLKVAPDHPVRSDVNEILKAAERASALTRQLLAFSRKQVLQPRQLDLNAIVQDMEKMLRRLIGEDIELASHLAPELGRVRADRNQIEQVLANLAVNARDAMSRGGKLAIETANVKITDEYMHQHVGVAPGDYVLLMVSDNGCGMDAETRSRIFEPFFTTKETGKGTGLGLSTVYGIVRQSEGVIHVYSEVGYGTTFKIYLPRVDEAADGGAPEAPEAAAGDAQAANRNTGETVLLVEDDDTVRKLISRFLRSEGYLVLDAPTPMEALTMAREHAGPIPLMVTDVVMPQMSGRELVGILKPERPEMKVLFISGYTEHAIINQGNMDPDAAFLQKPFTVGMLSQKLKEIEGETLARE